MAIAHICQSCGIDLAFVRARREPRYGLMMVECPDCGRTCVRRRHPLWRFWRTLRRVDWSLTVLVVNLAAFLAALWMMVAGVGWFVVTTTDLTFARFWVECWPGGVMVLLLAPVAAGAYLTAGLGHWRRRTAWITFGLLVMGGLTVGLTAYALDDLMRWPSQSDTPWSHPEVWLIEPLGMWIRAATLSFLLMLVALAGIPPGRLLLIMLRAGRRAIWRLRRRRQRKDRAT